MNDDRNSLAIALFTEVMATDQLVRARISRVLPKGMEISHFAVLNHLARVGSERTPAQLAQTFLVTRGAMTNTLSKLEWAGYVHIRPDWDDARRKLVTISPAGRQARDHAVGSSGTNGCGARCRFCGKCGSGWARKTRRVSRWPSRS